MPYLSTNVVRTVKSLWLFLQPQHMGLVNIPLIPSRENISCIIVNSQIGWNLPKHGNICKPFIQKAWKKISPCILEGMAFRLLPFSSGMISEFETDIKQKGPIAKIHTDTRYSGSLSNFKIPDQACQIWNREEKGSLLINNLFPFQPLYLNRWHPQKLTKHVFIVFPE